MDFVLSVNAAATCITTARDMAKLLMDVNRSWKEAEWKAKLTEVMMALGDAENQLNNIKQVIAEKDATITRLEDAFRIKDTLTLEYSAYWHRDTSGKTIGGPFCPRCWQADHVTRTLVADEREPQVECPDCKTSFCSPPVYHHLRPDVEEHRQEIRRRNREGRSGIPPAF